LLALNRHLFGEKRLSPPQNSVNSVFSVVKNMLILICYDVNTQTSAGRKRLRKVAKACENYGQRVQNSVFECLIDNARMTHLKNQLEELINPKTDSLRFYYLGNHWKKKIEHIGAKPSLDLTGTLIA